MARVYRALAFPGSPLAGCGVGPGLGVAEELIRELEADAERRRRLARLLVPEVYGDQELRTAVLNALYSEIATKDDVERLRGEIKAELRRIEERIDGLVKWVIGMIASMWVSLMAVLVVAALR